MIKDVMIDGGVLETLENLQSHLGFFYRKTIREVCDLLIAHSDWISVPHKDIMRILKALTALREDIEKIEAPAQHIVMSADPFDAKLQEPENLSEEAMADIAALELSAAGEFVDEEEPDSGENDE